MNIKTVEKRIRYSFNNKDLVPLAFTHKSYNSELNYERLEFLGDSIVGAVTTEYLYLQFENLSEGELSKRRAFVVSLENLYGIAEYLNISEFILMEAMGAEINRRIVGNVYEAVIGAIFIDSSYDITKNVFLGHLIEYMSKVDGEVYIYKDFKTILQELVQKHYNIVPKYYTIKKEGPDHKVVFTMCVDINNQILGYGSGLSKKDAAQNAAEEALKKIKF